MNADGKTLITGKMRILTPVHIGGAQEKHWQKGLDYIDKNGKVYLLDEKKLIAQFRLDQYVNAVSQKNLPTLCKSLNLNEYSSRVIDSITGGISEEIKTNIKNALSGKPIIPGTSLKGAIRSLFINKIGFESQTSKDGKTIKIEPFGQISEDINRYFIVADTEFNSTTFVNSKIYNLRSKNEGGWKHGSNGNTKHNFNMSGFTTNYETISLYDIADFRIVMNTSNIQFAKNLNAVKTNQNIETIYKSNIEDFFTLIKTYTKSYLDKEIAFFEKYKGEHCDKILAQLNRLKEENEKMPVLRVGIGSGFHSMTSDRLQSDHLIDEIALKNGRSRGKKNHKDSAKSRKIAFSGSGDNLRLYPMGFVQLMTDEYYESNKASFKKGKIVEKPIFVPNKTHENNEKEALTEEKKPDQPIVAEYTDITSIGKKPKLVDAIVTGQNGMNLTFKVCITGISDIIGQMRYPSGMATDTVIQVFCTSSNGKTIQYQGHPRKKGT